MQLRPRKDTPHQERERYGCSIRPSDYETARLPGKNNIREIAFALLGLRQNASEDIPGAGGAVLTTVLDSPIGKFHSARLNAEELSDERQGDILQGVEDWELSTDAVDLADALDRLQKDILLEIKVSEDFIL